MKDIDLQEDRIRFKIKRLEDEMLDVFAPQQLLLSLAGGLISRKKKKSDLSAASMIRAAEPGKVRSKKKALQQAEGLAKKPAVKKLARRVGISFLQWQAFNLALFIGKKIYRSVKEKKQVRKVQAAWASQ